ncbi:hypothetical protein [Mycobacterium kansasii]|uniref:hypothetical protein n=1 Tax=Mycobacterium kansasii TaxID=1768 RepID=UPI00267EE676|nr:hypothetical protein [Mycobacterium kansasii]
MPVEFIAEAIADAGRRDGKGFQTYHVMNPYDDGIGMDRFVDWLVDAGCAIHRIDDYGDWLRRFETALRGCPKSSVTRHYCRCCTTTRSGAAAARVDGSDRPVRAAVQDAKVGPDKDIPHISPQIHREVPQ